MMATVKTKDNIRHYQVHKALYTSHLPSVIVDSQSDIKCYQPGKTYITVLAGQEMSTFIYEVSTIGG